MKKRPRMTHRRYSWTGQDGDIDDRILIGISLLTLGGFIYIALRVFVPFIEAITTH